MYVFQTGGVDGGAAESAREAGGTDSVRRAERGARRTDVGIRVVLRVIPRLNRVCYTSW